MITSSLHTVVNWQVFFTYISVTVPDRRMVTMDHP